MTPADRVTVYVTIPGFPYTKLARAYPGILGLRSRQEAFHADLLALLALLAGDSPDGQERPV